MPMSKEYMREWRRKNKPRMKKYMHDYCQKYYSDPKNMARHNLRGNERRIRLKTYFCNLLGNRCEKCGLEVIPSENLCVFEFHHLNPNTKENEAEFRGRPSVFYQLIIEGEIGLLCANCHKIVTWKEKEET